MKTYNPIYLIFKKWPHKARLNYKIWKLRKSLERLKRKDPEAYERVTKAMRRLADRRKYGFMMNPTTRNLAHDPSIDRELEEDNGRQI